MGGCYSSDSECAVASPQHKLPTDRPPGLSQKGLQYSLLTNGDSEHQEDESLKQNAQQGTAGMPTLPAESQHLPEDAEKAKGVVPSDSGIESIGRTSVVADSGVLEKKEAGLCQSCHNKLKRLSRGSCEQCGQFRLDLSELNALVSEDRYCTCVPGQGAPHLCCQPHSTRVNASSACSPNRHSDVPGGQLKSNLKKEGHERGDSKHVRMSWRSADGVDLGCSMNTCMHRAKSEASDVFGDDVSFRAPLAHFDSVDHRLDVAGNANTEEGYSNFLTSRMSIYSEILELTDNICHCDFSQTAEECHGAQRSMSEYDSVTGSDAQATLPLLSQTHAPPPNSELPCTLTSGQSDVKEEVREHSLSSSCGGLLGKPTDQEQQGLNKLEDNISWSLCPSPLGHAAVEALEGLSRECQEGGCPVSVVVKGRQMVLMDGRGYSQLLSDMHILRRQLQHLATVIQEQEGRCLQEEN